METRGDGVGKGGTISEQVRAGQNAEVVRGENSIIDAFGEATVVGIHDQLHRPGQRPRIPAGIGAMLVEDADPVSQELQAAVRRTRHVPDISMLGDEPLPYC